MSDSRCVGLETRISLSVGEVDLNSGTGLRTTSQVEGQALACAYGLGVTRQLREARAPGAPLGTNGRFRPEEECQIAAALGSVAMEE